MASLLRAFISLCQRASLSTCIVGDAHRKDERSPRCVLLYFSGEDRSGYVSDLDDLPVDRGLSGFCGDYLIQ